MPNSSNTTVFAPSLWPTKGSEANPHLTTSDSLSFNNIFSFNTLGSTLVVGVAIATALILLICIGFVFRSFIVQQVKRRAEAAQQISEVFAVVSPRNPGDNSTPFSPELSHAIPIRDRVTIRENAIELADNVTIIESPRAKRRFSQNVSDLASPMLAIPGRVKSILRRQSSRDRDRDDDIILAFSPDEISGLCDRFESTSCRSLAIMSSQEYDPEIESKVEIAPDPTCEMPSDSILSMHSYSALPLASISEDFDVQLPLVPAIFSPFPAMPTLLGHEQASLLSPVMESPISTPHATSSAQRRGSAPPSLSGTHNYGIIPGLSNGINTQLGHSPVIGPIENLFPTSPSDNSTMRLESTSQSLIPITVRRTRSLPPSLLHFTDDPSLVAADLRRRFAAVGARSTSGMTTFRDFNLTHSSSFFLSTPGAVPTKSGTEPSVENCGWEEKSWTPGRYELELQRGKAFLNSAQLFLGSHSNGHRSNCRSTSV